MSKGESSDNSGRLASAAGVAGKTAMARADDGAAVQGAMIEPGWVRLFGRCDLGEAGLVSGWSEPEEAHVWSDGPNATFAVLTPVPDSRLRLCFEGGAFINAACPRQDLTLHVNGFYLGFWRVDDAATATFEVVVEPEQMFARGNVALLTCRWTLPNCARPADIGLGGDSRALGFCFRSFALWSEL